MARVPDRLAHRAGWPDTYSAGARVYIDTRTRLSQVTKDIAVESNIAAQAEGVRRRCSVGRSWKRWPVWRCRVLRRSPPTQADIVQDLRTAWTSGEQRAGGPEESAGRPVPITYTNRNRETARRVVDQLLNLSRQTLWAAARKDPSRRKIPQPTDRRVRQEARRRRGPLADFKREHAGLVPGATGGDYFSRLHAETDELDRDRLALTLAEQKRDELQRQLSSETGSTNGGGADTATQIRDTQARLDELLLRFTDKHPDVIAARRTLEDLKLRQKAEIEAVRRGDQAAIAATGLASSPVYQGIKLQLSQIDVEIAGARQQVAGQEAKIAEQRKMINTAPQVEAEYERLDRDYSVTHHEYQALVDRLSRAKLSDKADATGVVRFEVVDPPAVNPDPVFPNRLKLILDGAGRRPGCGYRRGISAAPVAAGITPARAS